MHRCIRRTKNAIAATSARYMIFPCLPRKHDSLVENIIRNPCRKFRPSNYQSGGLRAQPPLGIPMRMPLAKEKEEDESKRCPMHLPDARAHSTTKRIIKSHKKRSIIPRRARDPSKQQMRSTLAGTRAALLTNRKIATLA